MLSGCVYKAAVFTAASACADVYIIPNVHPKPMLTVDMPCIVTNIKVQLAGQ